MEFRHSNEIFLSVCKCKTTLYTDVAPSESIARGKKSKQELCVILRTCQLVPKPFDFQDGARAFGEFKRALQEVAEAGHYFSSGDIHKRGTSSTSVAALGAR